MLWMSWRLNLLKLCFAPFDWILWWEGYYGKKLRFKTSLGAIYWFEFYLLRSSEGMITFYSSGFFINVILFWLSFVLGNIKGFTGCLFSFFSSLTLSEYLRVFRVCSQHELAGETFATMTVQHFEPVKESFKTWVNLLPLNGVCFLSWSRALMHSFRANKDLLISAPSNLVYFPVSLVSAPHSLPAKSMKDIFP